MRGVAYLPSLRNHALRDRAGVADHHVMLAAGAAMNYHD
jgi:hypothetical protein